MAPHRPHPPLVRSNAIILFLVFVSVVLPQPVRSHPPCPFDPLCTCSKAGTDLGLVQCIDVPLESLPLLNQTRLYALSLNNNGLRMLDEYHLAGTGIWRLEIRQNRITRILDNVFWGLERSLWELVLSYNQLYYIPRQATHNLTKLRRMDLAGNHIHEIQREDFQGLKNSLRTLSLADNAIMHITPDAFANLVVLELLDLSGNSITYVHDITFQNGPPRLSHLDLADNLLTKVPFEAVAPLPALKSLDLSSNRIASTFDVLFNRSLSLDVLRLDNNRIKSIPPRAFQNFGVINRASLRRNPLTTIADDAFKEAKIWDLDLSECDISALHDNAFRGLEEHLHTLDLSGNKLSEAPSRALANLDALRNLSISKNGIKIRQALHSNSSTEGRVFEGIRYTLQHLNLERAGEFGAMSLDELRDMRNLRTLKLSEVPSETGKMTTTVTSDIFDGFGPAVEEVWLQGAGIRTIEDYTFRSLPGIKVLDLSENVIGSIGTLAFSRIEHSLRELYLDAALAPNIVHVPIDALRFLSVLQVLDVSNNYIIEVPSDILRALPNLVYLNLQDNRITSLSPGVFEETTFTELERLKISFNLIKRIPQYAFSGLRKLQYLYLDDNMVTEVESGAFVNMDKLEYLDLEGNNITTIETEAFQNLPSLAYLNLAYNRLKNLELNAFEQVGTLSTFTVNCSYNQLSLLSMNTSRWYDHANIKVLDLNHNNISAIETRYFEPVNDSLIRLDLSHNALTVASRSMFGELAHLQLLLLDHNRLMHLHPDTFEKSTRLRVLSLSHNNLTHIPANLFGAHTSLRSLDVSYNKLQSLPDTLLSQTDLQSLRVAGNMLMKFPEAAIAPVASNIRILDLSNNKIGFLSQDELRGCSSLLELRISQNGIKEIDSGAFAHTPCLTELDLSGNPLKKIPQVLFSSASALPMLETLNMANASLDAVQKLPLLPTLLHLNLSGNGISELQSTAFANVSNLRGLDLGDNLLSTVPSSLWNALPVIQEVVLSRNPITVVANDSFTGLASLRHLHLLLLPLQEFQVGALTPVQMLRSLAVGTFPKVRGYTIGRVVGKNHALRSLRINADGMDAIGLTHLGAELPPKTREVVFTGKSLRRLEGTPLRGIDAQDLRVRVEGTAIEELSSEVFSTVGRAQILRLHVFGGGTMRALSNPSGRNLFRPAPNTAYLAELHLDGHQWQCDCGLGWVEQWMRRWRRHTCADRGFQEAHVPCQSALRHLRMATCANKGNRSILAVLKEDLECGWEESGGAKTANLNVIRWAPLLIPILLVNERAL